MTSRERVLEALHLRQPDRVPWVESNVHNILAEKLLHRTDFEKATVTHLFAMPGLRIPPSVLDVLAIDNLTFSITPPRFVKASNGMAWTLSSTGSSRRSDHLGKVILPDPEDDEFYRSAREFVARYRDSENSPGCDDPHGLEQHLSQHGNRTFQPDVV